MVMGNKVLNNKECVFIPFSDDELSLMKERFNSLLYFPYEKISKDKSSLNSILPCVPYFMQGYDWKFVCSGIKMYLDKIERGGVIEYGCDVYLSGLKIVDDEVFDNYIKSSHFSKTDFGELVDELLSIISEYQVFESKHQVNHFSF